MTLRPFVRLALALGAFATCAPATVAADVAVKSPDAQVTVYQLENFSQPFDLAEDAALAPAPANASWWLLDLLLLGRDPGAGSVEIGVSRGFPDASTLTFFTFTATATKPATFITVPGTCAARCRIELRGDRGFVDAFANGRRVGHWSRASLAIRHPYLQYNAEVHGAHDALAGSLTRVRGELAGRPLALPVCALTTRGIDARLRGPRLEFAGRWQDDAPPTAFSLATRRTAPLQGLCNDVL